MSGKQARDGATAYTGCSTPQENTSQNGLTSAGILISLGHLQQLLGEGGARGPRGGLRLS